jgi:hypothetical protein
MQGHAYPARNEPPIFSTMMVGMLDHEVVEVPILHRLCHTAMVIDSDRAAAQRACRTHRVCTVDHHQRAAMSSWTKNTAVSRYATRVCVRKVPESIAVRARRRQTTHPALSRVAQFVYSSGCNLMQSRETGYFRNSLAGIVAERRVKCWGRDKPRRARPSRPKALSHSGST